jgi:hypothetical protein
MARPERFERSAYGLEVRCSIQLSYGRVALSVYQIPEAMDTHSTPTAKPAQYSA